MFSGLLNDEMNVMLASISATAYGGQTPTMTTVYSARPCRITQLSMEERDILQRNGVEATHMVYCEAGMAMNTQHEIVIDSVTYKITGFDTPDGSALAHHSEILVNRQS